MRLNKIIDSQWDFELLAEVHHTVDFMLAATIGEQDEGNVVIVEVSESLGGSRKALGGS
jgi:hypothetical protein